MHVSAETGDSRDVNDHEPGRSGTRASRALFERASRVMPRGNSRHSVFFAPYPLYCVRAAGCRTVDADGVERLDFVNNFSALVHGHGHPDVLDAVRRQAGCIMAAGLPTPVEVELAELLCERVESLEHVRFTNSGTEAVMMVLKAARAYTGRELIAKFEGCYHGTYDFAEVSQAPAADAWGPAAQPHSVPISRSTPQAILDRTLVLPFNDVVATARLLEKHRSSLAAVLVDPSPAHLGYLRVSPEMMQLLRDFTASEGALLIVDEVYSLRLNYRGMQHLYGVMPDLTVLGKIIGGGLSAGAFGGSRAVMSVFDPLPDGPAVMHGGTYNANPLSMAAGIASMRALTAAQITRLELLGERLRAGLRALSPPAGSEMVVEGIGSLTSVTFGHGPIRNYRDRTLLPKHRRRMGAFHRAMLDRGIAVAPQGLIVLSTAMDTAEIDALLWAADSALRELGGV